MNREWFLERSMVRVEFLAKNKWSAIGALLAAGMLALVLFASGARAQGSGDFYIGAIAEIDNMDYIYAPTGIAAGTAQRLVFDRLAILNPSTMEYVPRIAESWEILDGGARWRFHLREGILFHNGEELTSEDVKFTFDVARLPEYESPYQSRFDGVTDVVAVDRYTVDVVLQEAVLPALGLLIWEHYIYPKSVYEADREGFGLNPVGSGPFKVSSWDRGFQLVLERNEDYFLGASELQRVILRVVPEPAARVLAFEAGELDLIMDVAFEDVPRLRDTPGVQMFETAPVNMQYLGFNWEDDLVGGDANRQTRHAIAYAVNEAAVLSLYSDVGGAYSKNIVPPTIWSYNDDVPAYDYDPERAIEILAEQGWERDASGALRNAEGEQLTLDLHTTPDRLGMVDAAQIVQENLQDIGIRVNIRSFEFTTYFDDIRSLNYQLHLARRNNIMEPDELRTYSHSSTIPRQNRTGLAHAELDALLERGYAEQDPQAREEIYREIQQIMAEELTMYPLAATPAWIGSTDEFVFPEGMVLSHVNDIINYVWEVRPR